MATIKEINSKTFEHLNKAGFTYKNRMQAPKVTKVMVSSGIGSIIDKKRKEAIAKRLTEITGQKVKVTKAKKSIAGFKSRENDDVGLIATLRGSRMYDFLEKLVNIALPRTRDFRGIPNGGFDAMGNYTFGIKEHIIFPEAAEEDVRDIFGMGVTVVTTAKTKKECDALMRLIGMPIVK